VPCDNCTCQQYTEVSLIENKTNQDFCWQENGKLL